MDWDLILSVSLTSTPSASRSAVVYAMAAIGPEPALRLHGPAQLRPGRLHAGRRVQLAMERRHLLGCRSGCGLFLASSSLARPAPSCSACRPCACGPTTWPSSPSPPAEIIRSWCPLGALPDHHRRAAGSRTSPATSSTSTRSPAGDVRLDVRPFTSIERQYSAHRNWVLLVGWSLVALTRAHRLPRPQPVGSGAEGHPRGRGRRPRPGQERVLLQDAGLVLGGVIGASPA